MKRLFKWICGLLLVGILIGVIFMIPVVLDGYDMYVNAVSENSIQTKVQEIQDREDYISIDQIPQDYIDTLLESEDHRFYSHPGFDIFATARALFNDIKAGSFVEGGSTIDQQLAKNLYFSFNKTLDRKAAELFVVSDLETMYTKDQILELYINICYYGNDIYGLQAASEYYYNVEPSELNQDQIDSLVYTIKAPNNRNPEVLGIACEACMSN